MLPARDHDQALQRISCVWPSRNRHEYVMITRAIGQAIDQVSALDELGSSLKSAIHNAVLKGGKPTRKLADLLHGTWLGHPLRSEEHTSELQSRGHLVCRLLREKK